jgi:DNA-binding GntR family transcriptional regulator
MTPNLAIDLDRSSPVPLYFQVAEQIAEAIRRGDLTPGSRLDNDILLADKLGLSRPTIRQAIQYLVDKGLLVRKRGVGTQVVHGQVKRSVELTSLYDDLRRAGQEPATQVLVLEPRPVEEDKAAILGVEPGSEILYVERLRFAAGEPLAVLHNWLPLGLANQRIGARAATQTEAKLLDERRGAPLLTMIRTTYDDQGRAVEHGSHVYRASHYSLEVTLIER